MDTTHIASKRFRLLYLFLKIGEHSYKCDGPELLFQLIDHDTNFFLVPLESSFTSYACTSNTHLIIWIG